MTERAVASMEICSICLDPPTDKTHLYCCEHSFCLSCIRRWTRTKARVYDSLKYCKQRCPVCRRSFRRLYTRDEIIDLRKKYEQPKSIQVKQIMFWPVLHSGCIINLPFEMQYQTIPLPVVNGLLAGIPFGAFCFVNGQAF